MTGFTNMVGSVKRGAYRAHCAIVKHWGKIVAMAMAAVLIGVGGQLILGRAQATFWIVFGGNTDPGDGNGGGLARQQFVDGGWIDNDHIFQVTWNAHIEQGTVPDTNSAMPAAHDAYNRFCKANRCIVAGFSLGTMPALQLQAETGHPVDQTYLFGGPQPSPGIWHDQYADNPFVEPGLETFGQFNPDRFAPAGVHNYFDGRDPYNNAAPQCSGPGNFGLTLDGHRIIRKDEADASRQWTGTDGVLEFEVVAPPPVASGADPSPFWAGCEGGDWHNTPNSPGPQTNPDQPGLPGFPGIPGGSPIPSQEGNMPAFPGLPGQGG